MATNATPPKADEKTSTAPAPKKAEGVELGVKSTAQLDLEARLKDDTAFGRVVKTLNPAEQLDLHEDGYVGVDPVYQNYASDTEKPGAAESGPEKQLEEFFIDSVSGDAAQPASDEIKKNAETIQSGTTGV